MKHPPLMIGVLALWLAAGSWGASGAGAIDLSLSIRQRELMAAPGSGEPNLCTGPDNVVYISWIEPAGQGRHALRFARRAPGSDAWSAPRTIAEGENWFVNWADFPSLAVGADGTLVAHWLARSGAGAYAYSVLVSHSSDRGKKWSRPRILHEDDTQTEHGFVSLVPLDSQGGTLALWLDGRNFARGANEMTLRSRIVRPDGSWGPEMLIDGLVCDCCQTSGARLSGGRAVVAYRDRSEEEIRDIYVARFENGVWSDPVPVHADGWRIPGCPVNGPSVDARGDRLVVAWFTGAQGAARVLAAFSSDGGRRFSTPIRVDRGAPAGRVDAVMLDDGSALVSWIESEEETRPAALLVRRVLANGAASEPVRIDRTTTARASGFPRMARAGAEIVFAWTEVGDPSRVRTATGELR